MITNSAAITPHVNLFVDGKKHGERRWSAVPALGHRLLYKTGGVQRTAVIVDVLWGGTPDFPIVDVYSETQRG